MLAQRTLARTALVVAFGVFVGCSKPAEPTPATTTTTPRIEIEPPAVKPLPPQPPPKVETPAPPAIAELTDADKTRVANAEKLGARIHGPEADGGYIVSIEGEANGDAILSTLKGAKFITSLNCDNAKITDTALQHLNGCEHLQSLTFHRCEKITGAELTALPKLPRLHTLWFAGSPITDAACPTIGRCAKLENVRLSGTKITDVGLRELARLPQLDTLNLDDTAITGTAFATAGWANLKYLEALNSEFNDEGALAVAKLPTIESVILENAKITDAGAEALGTSKTLLIANLRRTAIGDRALAGLGHSKSLRALNVAETKITDAGLGSLATASALEELDLSQTAITGTGFTKFPQRPKLRKLTVNDTTFNDAGAAHLSKFPGLTRLDAANCVSLSDSGLSSLTGAKKLTRCDLTATAAGDDTAKLLGALPEFQDANFTQTKLTNVGVQSLALAPKIRHITAHKTQVTREAAERAKMGRKNVEITVE